MNQCMGWCSSFPIVCANQIRLINTIVSLFHYAEIYLLMARRELVVYEGLKILMTVPQYSMYILCAPSGIGSRSGQAA